MSPTYLSHLLICCAHHPSASRHLASSLSARMNGDINGLFNRHCHNFAGRVKLRPTYEGVLAHVVPTLRQIFQRVPARSLASSADDRFAHFVAHTLPQLRCIQWLIECIHSKSSNRRPWKQILHFHRRQNLGREYLRYFIVFL